MSALDTRQINQVLYKNCLTKEDFIGVFAYDMIPNIMQKDFSLIINLDRFGLPGSHWIAIKSKKDKLYLFDTYSRGLKDFNDEVQTVLIKRVIKNRTVIHNSKFVQNPFSNLCGQFCIYVLILFGFDISFSNILNYFSENLLENDKMVYNFVNNFL